MVGWAAVGGFAGRLELVGLFRIGSRIVVDFDWLADVLAELSSLRSSSVAASERLGRLVAVVIVVVGAVVLAEVVVGVDYMD